jgi:hypothetical protein
VASYSVKVRAYHEVREYQQLLDDLHCLAEDDPDAVATKTKKAVKSVESSVFETKGVRKQLSSMAHRTPEKARNGNRSPQVRGKWGSVHFLVAVGAPETPLLEPAGFQTIFPSRK